MGEVFKSVNILQNPSNTSKTSVKEILVISYCKKSVTYSETLLKNLVICLAILILIPAN